MAELFFFWMMGGFRKYTPTALALINEFAVEYEHFGKAKRLNPRTVILESLLPLGLSSPQTRNKFIFCHYIRNNWILYCLLVMYGHITVLKKDGITEGSTVDIRKEITIGR